MNTIINDGAVADVQAALKDYIKNNISEPLARDSSLKNSLSRDLQQKTAVIASASKNIYDMTGAMEKLSNRGIKELTNSLFKLSKGTKSAKDALKKELASLVEDLLQTMVKNIKIPPTVGMPDILQTKSSKKNGGILGGLFDFAGSLLGFRASGGSVGAGQAFIVGERGPELLLTGRAGGQIIPNEKIAGQAGTATKINVNVINNAGADISVKEKQNSNGIRELEIMVDNMVAKSLANSGSRIFQTMESTYGIRPILNGR